jgi:menaquinone-9 beta-reductase
MWDVLIAGAGPAGSMAATILARAGARVLVVDRARFPRDKLCGDSINPGTLGILHRWDLASRIERDGLPIDGMVVCDAGGVQIEATYPTRVRGRSLMRRDLDQWLLGEAIAAGAQFEERVTVVRPLSRSANGSKRGPCVGGVVVRSQAQREVPIHARVTIAADGRRSRLAFGLGLAACPTRPRRWAVGVYVEGRSDARAMGEMHICAGRYVGVAPVPGGLTNICAVGEPAALGRLNDPQRVLRSAIDRDPTLRDRFADARFVTRPVVLGPLAIDTTSAGIAGLLLAGDAAGFVDPMTGDGLRFAVRGAELAAETAIDMLATGNVNGHIALEHARRAAFASKWRFDRALRRLVDSRTALRIAILGAAVAPAYIQRLVAFAGDCDTLDSVSQHGCDCCHVDRSAAASPHAGGCEDVHAAGL